MKSLILLSLLVAVSIAVPTDEDLRGREDLSDHEHYSSEGKHNSEYDHEAFLGKSEAETFRKLTPAESKRRLSIIVDRIDKDKNGQITKEELRDWVRYVAEKSSREVAEKRWEFHDVDKDGFITFEEMKTITFGEDQDPDDTFDTLRGLTFRESEKRLLRRFNAADENGDKKLSLQEFTDYLFPHEVPRMKDVVIDEALEDMDKNKDKFVTLKEYIHRIWHPADPTEEEPSWLQTEREQFGTHKDLNKDGRMDRQEFAKWLYPANYDRYISEASHLMYHGDSDKDQILTKDEILSSQDLFVGSHATEYGKYLERHDEF